MTKKMKLLLTGIILLGIISVPTQAKTNTTTMNYKDYFVVTDPLKTVQTVTDKIRVYSGNVFLFSATQVSEDVWTTDCVNIRKYPNINSKVIKTCSTFTKLKRVGKSKFGWDIVEVKGKYYYVWNEYLTTKEPECLGRFKLTAYCSCEFCSEGYGNQTSTGAIAEEGRTIAVDPNVIEYGTVVVINGEEYIAEDCGGAVKGDIIDVYLECDYSDHSRIDDFGVQYATVYIKNY